MHLLQFEREEVGALAKVLDKHELHALFPVVALEAGLPSVLQVLHLLPSKTFHDQPTCLQPRVVTCACMLLTVTVNMWSFRRARLSLTLPPVLALCTGAEC